MNFYDKPLLLLQTLSKYDLYHVNFNTKHMFSSLGCESDELSCYDGSCYNANYRCDSWVDCSHGEDDIGCSRKILEGDPLLTQ